MCGLCFAGLLAARVVGFTNRALVPLDRRPGGRCSGSSGCTRRRSACPRPAPSPTSAAACSSAGPCPSTCARGSPGRSGRSGAVGARVRPHDPLGARRAARRSHPRHGADPERAATRRSTSPSAPSAARPAPWPRRRCPRAPRADSVVGMGSLDDRVIAVAGAAGGLGPEVALAAGRGRRDGRAHRPRPGAPRRRRRGARASARSGSTRGWSTCSTIRGRPTGRRRSRSASGASTASCTWSAAGRAESRSRPPRSPTTSGSTTCSCAR